MEAPISSESEGGSDDEIAFVMEDLEDEVDINIHFHCEHCIKLAKCDQRVKPGWSCELIFCPNGCNHRLHSCKMDEHKIICSHERVPCINSGYGCPHFMLRGYLAKHLPHCPASVIICTAEWNRWALGAKEREKVSIGQGLTALYNPTDLDMALALHDQELVNEMHSLPRQLRASLCNSITRRYPCLPLTIRGSRHDTEIGRKGTKNIQLNTTGEEEEGLTPGLSFSVCTELLRAKKQPLVQPLAPPVQSTNCEPCDQTSTVAKKKVDYTDLCCSHGIIKHMCIFCRDDPDAPDYTIGKIFREKLSLNNPGCIKWVSELCIEKVRKRGHLGSITYKKVDDFDEGDMEALEKLDLIVDTQGLPIGQRARYSTPPPVPLTPQELTMELILKHYSRHQTKPRAMFTFQCMQEVRRDEYSNHYQNVHSEIQEGLEGWLLQRCPLHIYGCPYAVKCLHPSRKDANVVFCPALRAFGTCPVLDHEPKHNGEQAHSRSPSMEKGGYQRLTPSRSTKKPILDVPISNSNEVLIDEQYYASSDHVTYLPVEILEKIASYLDGFSINNLALTCKLMREICFSLLNERGLVILEWVRYIEDGQVRWREGRKRQFFSKAFQHVDYWGFKDVAHMANHLKVCSFNDRHISSEKFTYAHSNQELLRKMSKMPVNLTNGN